VPCRKPVVSFVRPGSAIGPRELGKHCTQLMRWLRGCLHPWLSDEHVQLAAWYGC
jgi:hypothetical protein